ncbi:DUF3299 domain-containing protein [Phenylobacterium sp.]|uniref:DUF3299 domain-containing protein n=1 Tax=Phenylobacterium sp. TaxID=1871053 RepID=UPI002730FB49|nr:DUF3299 domain-containing protein [Phenylobacterium sp.]MDP1617705.1 DUF3299 domain-containing protein [Phenylobacterium sp.]MDP1986729.1 DUF3299 domain-containing protein [Phenylobacterium sp.]
MPIRPDPALTLALLVLTACGPPPEAPETPALSETALPQAAPAEALEEPDMAPTPAAVDDIWADFESGQSPMAQELAGERALQLTLPTADGPQWEKLRQTRVWVDEDSQLFQASHPAAVRELAGKPFRIQGFMLPLEMAEQTRRFLISPYTPVCFYHPPAEPNEVIEVWLDRPIRAGYHLIEVEGVLNLANDGEKGLFFQIRGGRARIVQAVDEGV